MSHFVHTGGLKRQYHHVKTNRDDGEEGYEPAMVIINESRKGRSFMIPLSAFWKYVEPMDNRNAAPRDMQDFEEIVRKALWKQKMAATPRARFDAGLDLAGCAFASALWNTNHILPCVGWNLHKIMTMFDIEVSPQAAAQILLWIQDGLEDLKNMPDAPVEKELVEGEMTLWEGGKQVAQKDMTVKESELVVEEGN